MGIKYKNTVSGAGIPCSVLESKEVFYMLPLFSYPYLYCYYQKLSDTMGRWTMTGTCRCCYAQHNTIF